MRIPKKITYPIAEEVANAITHGLGFAAAIVALVLMLVKAIPVSTGGEIAAVSVYGGCLILMFLASTLYHAIHHLPTKRILKRIDHCAIYLLIAGSYTPYLLISLDSLLSNVLLVVIWAFALLGVVIKSVYIERFKKLSLLSYIVMGWAALLVGPSLYSSLPSAGFALLLLGGLAYTFGTVFYAWRGLNFAHAIWHVFVLIGAVLQCLSIALYVIPSPMVSI